MISFLQQILQPENILLSFFAYILAATPTAYLVGRILYRVNITKIPEHAHSAASMWRLVSKKSGILVFILDFLKGFIPCLITESLGGSPEVIIFVGFWAILGHCFSPWLYFSGGRGAATMCGVVTIVFWPAALFGLLFFILLILLKTRAGYASMLGVLLGFGIMCLGNLSWLVVILLGLLVILIIYRHKSYLKFLLENN